MKIMAAAMIRMMSKKPKAPSTRWRRAKPCPPSKGAGQGGQGQARPRGGSSKPTASGGKTADHDQEGRAARAST